MIVTLATLAAIWYLKHKIKGMWKAGHCRYIIGAVILFIVFMIWASYTGFQTQPSVRLRRLKTLLHIDQNSNLFGKRSNFLSESSGCIIPVLNPYDPAIVDIVSDIPESKHCEKSEPIMFELDFNSTLHVVKSPESLGWTNCFFGEINLTRSLTDNFILSDKLYPINTNQTLLVNMNSTHIGIQCDQINSTLKKIVDVIQNIKPMIVQSHSENTKDLHHQKINVELIMLESVSRMAFLRSFSDSYQFIMERLGGYDLQGLSIVKDTRFPWLVPMSLNSSDSEFMWNVFKSHGYHTVLTEDCTWNLFDNTELFRRQNQFDMNIKLGNVVIDQSVVSTPCHGPFEAFEGLINHWKKLADFGIQQECLHFLMLSSCSLTQDKVHGGQIGDQLLVNHLISLQKNNHLNKSAIFIFGNHGSRFPKLIKTEQGYLEFRMPVGIFIFPKWFRLSYPLAMNNLHQNSRILTTHFDAYETILDLSNLETISDKNITQRTKMFEIDSKSKGIVPRGISLFLPIPKERDCKSAGIDEGLCICHSNSIALPTTHEIVISSVTKVLDTVNKELKRYLQCAELRLFKVHQALLKLTSNKEEKMDIERIRSDNKDATLKLSFTTSPLKGNFDVVLQGMGGQEWSKLNLTDIKFRGRNAYPVVRNRDKKCISNIESSHIQKMCYCLNIQ